ncbi:hypothetical protein AGMMS49936_11670 [Endomicrobiia bacterium]|nr:hypothetical protein AGMMS49936_11670 [Endomicrobiia bacterium]
MYYLGRGVQQNYNKAINWIEKAAKQGHAWAQDSLGRMYYGGIGVQQD